MQDIAKRCGIGRSTVSFILNGTASRVGLSEKLCEKVRQTAKEMGYRRNEIASSFHSGKLKVVAFVTNDSHSASYTMRIIAGINECLNKHNYSLKIYIHQEKDSLDRLADKIIANMIPGVILSLPPDACEELRRKMEPYNVKAATATLTELSNPVIQVWTDDTGGAASVADKFYELGHRRLGLVYFEHVSAPRIKTDSYLRRLGELGLPNDESIAVGLSRNTACNLLDAERVKEFFHRPNRPTAVFCEADPLALRFIQYTCLAGYRIPDDISVIGYADVDYAEFSNPPLSTIRTPFEEIGLKAAELLLEAIRNDCQTNQKIIIPVSYVERMSAAPFVSGDEESEQAKRMTALSS